MTLLDGVTGSGKTEVYFEAVADTIRAGRQSLILMPEIALTAQFLDRFAARFGTRPAEWHSELTPRKRARTWAAVADGEVSVVVGARSALFLPYADLGLIIVDEEHDPAYKQEDGVHYHARDMAVVRGHIAQNPGGAVVGDAVARDRGQCAARPLSRGSRCRSGSAASACRRSRRSICAPSGRRAAVSSRRRSPARCKTAIGAQASRRCCFSIAAATRR